MDFAHARYNSSTQGRFTSPDSVMGSIGNPQSLNRYAYVNNNPMNFTDPTGHMPSGGAAASIHDGEGGGGLSWDDPNRDDGFPQRYLDEINGWIAKNEAHSVPAPGEGVAAGTPVADAVKGDDDTDTAEGKEPEPQDPELAAEIEKQKQDAITNIGYHLTNEIIKALQNSNKSNQDFALLACWAAVESSLDPAQQDLARRGRGDCSS